MVMCKNSKEKSVFDQWKLKDFDIGEGVELGVYKQRFSTADWIDVPVPGDVHLALLEAGRIPDPFYGKNELECTWIEKREWWYRCQFEYTESQPSDVERLLLLFHGLDTFTRIWLNGEPLGDHCSMFYPAAFELSDKINTHQTNTIALRFDPPTEHVRDKPALSWGYDQVHDTKRNWMRKAQFGFGWDWGPRLPTVGIWRPVEIIRQSYASIADVHFRTLMIEPSGGSAQVSARVEIRRFAGSGSLHVEFNLYSPEGESVASEQSVVHSINDPYPHIDESLTVNMPQLWWTHDLGEPNLYTLQVRLLQNGDELDRQDLRVGIRRVELDQSLDPDEPGARFFRFRLNGVPIFARGANWIPASSFVGALTQDRYGMLLDAAREANMNMLRVWGGGIYEHDVFYELCDQLGILIWQDFMFACAPYPQDDPDFVSEVKAEVHHQVRRLRNHPCLALWCGNNENQWLHIRRAPEQERNLPVPGTLIYEEIMPAVVNKLDGSTPYWPGSPFGGPQPNSMLEGDVHDWHVWHGFPVREVEDAELERLSVDGPGPEDVTFLHYAENMGRFISEFGMHASPVYETLRRCLPSDQLYHHSPSMDHHNKDDPKKKGDNLMLTVTGLPRDLEEYIDYSMIAQAEGLKFGIEHFRRRKPHCSGTLFWQFNDCWPSLSWSVLDYYGFGKAGYYYVRRAYAPVLASFKASEDGRVELWITNDTLEEVEDTVLIQLGNFTDGKVWEESIGVTVPANSSNVVWGRDLKSYESRPDKYLSVRSGTDVFPGNRHFFAAIKDLQRVTRRPQVEISSIHKHSVQVSIYSPVYLFYVHLIIPDEYTLYSDNYFDLLPGEKRMIEVSNPKITLTPDLLTVKCR
jgi:beta-mannosidase